MDSAYAACAVFVVVAVDAHALALLLLIALFFSFLFNAFAPTERHTVTFLFLFGCIVLDFGFGDLVGSKICDTNIFVDNKMTFSLQVFGNKRFCFLPEMKKLARVLLVLPFFSFFFFHPACCERGHLGETALGDGYENAAQYRFDR